MPEATLAPAVLRVRGPVGLTILLALCVTAGLGVLCEVGARSTFGAVRLPAESIGSGQPQLDKKLVLLRRMAAEKPIDCLYLGSSQVYRSMDPEVIGPVVSRRSGRDLRAFNFGLGGMSEIGEAPLAQILLKKFHPRLIIVGASSYGLDDRRDIRFMSFLEASPWYQWQFGKPSLDGFLLDRSVAFRRWHGHLFWAEPTPEKLKTFKRSVANMSPSGHGILEPGAFRDVDDQAAKDLADFRVAPSHLDALEALLKLRSPQLEILVVEMPVHEKVIRLYGRGQQDHEEALAKVEQLATRYGAQFWRWPADRTIPSEAWADFVHVNRLGAEIYSRWIGERLADALKSGRLAVPAA